MQYLEAEAATASDGTALYQQTRNSSGGYDVDIPDVESITGSMLASNPGLRAAMEAEGLIDRQAQGTQVSFNGTLSESMELLGGIFTESDTNDQYNWSFSEATVVDGGVVTTRTVTDTGATITRTREAGAPADDPDPWAHTVKRADGTEIAGGEIGSILGSSIGNAIAGGNVFAQIAASSVLGTLLQNVGQTFGTMLDQDVSFENAAYTSFANFDTELAQQVHSAGLGAVSSFLSAELAESLGVHATDFGGQLFSYAASTGINTLLDYTLGNVAQNLNFTDGLSGALFGSGALPDPLTLGVGFAKFLGGYVAHEIVAPENLGGYLGSAVGSALTGIGTEALVTASTAVLQAMGVVGSTITSAVGSLTAGISAATGIASASLAPFTFGISIIIGTLLGTVLGNLLGGLFSDQGYGKHSMIMRPDALSVVDGVSQTDDWDFGKVTSNMRQSALALTSAVLGAVGGHLASQKEIEIGFYYNDHPYMRTYINVKELDGTVSYSTQLNNFDPNALVTYGAIELLKRAEIAGGDLYMKRALANTKATSIEQLMGELQVARDYETYLANKDVIDALIAMDPTSAFAAGCGAAANDNMPWTCILAA